MGLLKAEYLKLSRRKLYLLMLIILGFFVGVAGFFVMVFPDIAPEIANEIPQFERPEIFTLGAQQVASQTWFPLILAVVLLGGELGSTVWATSLTRDPRKPAHIGARVVVLVIASWLAMLGGIALWTTMAALWTPGEGILGASEWLSIAGKVGVVQMAWVAVGLGAVSMLRSVGPAIGAALALSFGEGLLALWPPYENVSMSAATSGLFQFDGAGFFSAFVPGGDLTTLHTVAIVAGWTILGAMLTYWGLVRNDA